MKTIFNSLLVLAAIAFSAFAFTACEDEPDKYEISGGNPVIRYIRPLGLESGDSILTGAYMDNRICIVGENLRSITKMLFNDQEAQLIPSLITDHTLIVTVPGTVPGEVFNKIFMINNSNDTTTYDFKVLVPGPTIISMNNEWAPAGDVQTIYGSYFIDDPNVPITLTIAGQEVPFGKDQFDGNHITFTVPEGLPEGDIEVTTVYGTQKAPFRYKDSRGMITNFDGEGNSGTKGIVPQGWNLAMTYSNEGGIDGYYAQVGDGTLKMPADGGWTEGFKISWWCGDWKGDPMSITEGAGVPVRNLFPAGYFGEPEKLAFKFELCIPASNPWMAGALQVLFVNNKVAANDTWQNNTYIQPETGMCRGLYAPWSGSGSFDTGGKWITVTMPITNFTYNMDGTAGMVPITPESFDTFTMWPVSGGLQGTECAPILRYDNIRIVPIN